MGEKALPLYRMETKLPQMSGDGHLGLWFDKFFDEWRRVEPRSGGPPRPGGLADRQAGSGVRGWSTQATRDENPKLDWLRKLLASGARTGREDLLRESAGRLLRLVEAHGGRWRVFRTSSRFVTGLGRQHPLENGFAWHPTLGVPYLPGSSVKGMVRAWAGRFASDGASELLMRLFGPGRSDREKGAESRQGAITFLDAIPIQRPELAADVMTPHYANWTKEDLPGDWRSPTPVFFLTTEVGARLLFGLIPSGDVPAGELDLAMEWLEEALAWAGAGAKTAVGYGRMARDEVAEAELRARVQARRVEMQRAEG